MRIYLKGDYSWEVQTPRGLHKVQVEQDGIDRLFYIDGTLSDYAALFGCEMIDEEHTQKPQLVTEEEKTNFVNSLVSGQGKKTKKSNG